MQEIGSSALRGWLLDLTKIVEGAIDGNERKVLSYTKRLVDRLRTDGESKAADHLEALISDGSQVKKLSLARRAGTDPIPVDAEARLPIADECVFDPKKISVILPDEAQAVVSRFLRYVSASDALAARGVDIVPSMLLFGPPGCGKTELAKHISAQLGLPIITARIDALISSYLGSTSKNVRSLFEHAQSRPCILFLDELDALGKMRDDDKELGELKRVVISLLQNIDAMDKGHVLLAATNHPHLLDPALWRRFTFHVEIGKPQLPQRQAMLRQFLGNDASQSDVNLMAAATDGFSGAELRQVAHHAIRDAVLANRKDICVSDVLPLIFRMKTDDQTDMGRDALIRRIHELNPEMSQSRIAGVFKVDQSTVSRTLRGKNNHGKKTTSSHQSRAAKQD